MERAAVVLTTFICVFSASFFLFTSRDPYQAAAHKGVEWLLSYPEEYKNPGVFWALKEVAGTHCNSNELEKKLTERFESIPRSEVERAYFYFPEAPISEDARIASTTARYDQWLLAALSCKERPLPPDVRDALAARETSRGYDLTHRYLALSYIKRLGCRLEDDLLDTRIAGIETALRDEEVQSEAFTDLSAERAALLLWGGRQDLVSDTWLLKIKGAQGPTGGWGDRESAIPNPHTTALATWALAQASGRCPL